MDPCGTPDLTDNKVVDATPQGRFSLFHCF